MLWFKSFLVENFSDQFDFDPPLSQIYGKEYCTKKNKN